MSRTRTYDSLNDKHKKLSAYIKAMYVPRLQECRHRLARSNWLHFSFATSVFRNLSARLIREGGAGLSIIILVGCFFFLFVRWFPRRKIRGGTVTRPSWINSAEDTSGGFFYFDYYHYKSYINFRCNVFGWLPALNLGFFMRNVSSCECARLPVHIRGVLKK